GIGADAERAVDAQRGAAGAERRRLLLHEALLADTMRLEEVGVPLHRIDAGLAVVHHLARVVGIGPAAELAHQALAVPAEVLALGRDRRALDGEVALGVALGEAL